MPNEEAKFLPGINALEEAEHRAFKRGQAQAQLDSKLEVHFRDDDRRFMEIKDDQQKTTTAVSGLSEKVDKLGSEIKTGTAVAAARAKDAKDAAERQVSTRTFVLGLIGAVGAILAALAASGHL